MRVAASLTLAAAALVSSADAFTSASQGQVRSTELYGYVPSGFTPESYKKFKEQEAKKKKANLGRLGPKGFQSRSFQSFQEAMERGEASHLMPVFNAQDKIKRGEIRPEDVPVSSFRVVVFACGIRRPPT